MLFKRKFFLDLEAEAGKPPAPPAVVAPVAAKPAPAAKTAPAPQPAGAIKPRLVAPGGEASAPAETSAPAASSAAVGQPAPLDAIPAAAQASGLTTAEAIAAELAAEQSNRPAPTQATFAPEFLTPGASPLRRRRAGADLGRFRQLAGGILRS